MFRNKILIRKLVRWFKFMIKIKRIQRNPFMSNVPIGYSLKKILKI